MHLSSEEQVLSKIPGSNACVSWFSIWKIVGPGFANGPQGLLEDAGAREIDTRSTDCDLTEMTEEISIFPPQPLGLLSLQPPAYHAKRGCWNGPASKSRLSGS